MPGKTAAKTVWFLAKHWNWFPMRSRLLGWVRGRGYAGLGGKWIRVKTTAGPIMDVVPLDYVGWVLIRDRRIEPQVTAVFQDLLHPGDAVLDIGANYGYFTLLAASLVGPAGHVYAFEPNPSVASRLLENVGLNNFTNVRLHCVAVSNVPGTVEFHVAAQHSGLSSLRPLDGETATTISVHAAAIDSFADEMSHVRLVKIDVEGAELLVLEGMKELLRYDHPYVTLEVTDRWIRQMHGDASQVFALLHAFGYATYEIGPGGTHPLSSPKGDQTCVLAAPPGSHVPGLGTARR